MRDPWEGFSQTLSRLYARRGRPVEWPSICRTCTMMEHSSERRAKRVELASAVTTRQPSLQRALCFAGGAAGKKADYTDVFVQVRPMNSFAPSDEAPVATFARGAMRQSWIPSDGHTDGSTVHEVDDERVVGDRHVLGQRGAQFTR